MKKVHNRKGFTLIELIIVIVIIAILAAIAIPAVSQYVGDANESQKDGNYAVVKSAAGAAAADVTANDSSPETVNLNDFVEELETILEGSATVSTSGAVTNIATVKMDKAEYTYEVTVYTSGAVKIKPSYLKD